VWHPGEDDTVRFLAGRGIQLPNLVNLGGFILPFPPFGYAGGVPDLQPTVVHNYEISWDRNLSGPAAKLRLSAFVGRTRDIVAAAGMPRLADGVASGAFNAGGSDTAGIEASIGGTLREEWRWRCSYLYQDVDDAFDPALPPEVTYTDFENTTSKHVLKASADWERGRWTVGGFVLYRSKFIGIRADALFSQAVELVSVPGYTVVDGRVAFRPTDTVELSLSGRNLTGTERQSAAPDVERAFYATLSVDFGSRE
jgi:iron complex outermembrane receptor protein